MNTPLAYARGFRPIQATPVRLKPESPSSTDLRQWICEGYIKVIYEIQSSTEIHTIETTTPHNFWFYTGGDPSLIQIKLVFIGDTEIPITTIE